MDGVPSSPLSGSMQDTVDVAVGISCPTQRQVPLQAKFANKKNVNGMASNRF